MAQFGCCYPCFCPEGADKGVVIGSMVAANLTVTLASGEIYADDGLKEQVSEFASGSIAETTDDMDDQIASVLYGCKVQASVVTYNKGDSAPRGTHGYYKTLMKDGKKYFRAYIYPRVKAALGNDNAQTRGSSITFTPVNTTFTVFADDNGNWRETKTFDTEAAAKAYVAQACKVAQYHTVELSVQGATSGKGVDQAAVSYVANGEAYTLKLTVPSGSVQLFDNGVDQSSAVSSGGKARTYSIPAVNEPHTIAVIFGG